MAGGIVSIGYEGRTLDEFISTLQAEGVEVLVDVRLNAISRKVGFSKMKLVDATDAAGIEYVHERTLGNPIDNRGDYRAGLAAARALYRKQLDTDATDAVDRLVKLAQAQRVAVLCVERDHAICHHDELVRVVQERDPKVQVTHVE